MKKPDNILPQSHLVNILCSTKEHHPNFVLLLGAGSSVTSGVKLVSDLIKDWRNQMFKMYGSQSESLEDYLKRNTWYDTSDEYSILFEKLFDQPSQRREFIETCITNATPSWGYIYLVNLLRAKVFNTVFTTNFDDLLNEACYLFSNEIRPIVCAHDSSISSVRITSNRPKVIKLHGDFLFDNIKNTIRELETLEQNTQDKFKQYASEYGFIVLGYSGNDRSIMDTFNTLLRFDNYFPHGIYWCIRKGSSVSPKVDLLTRFPKFKIVEIDGFDEFFAELHSCLNLSLQPEMSDPYSALANRLNNLLSVIKINQDETISHPIIERDIKELGKQITKLSSIKSNNFEEDQAESLPVPYGLLANINARAGNYPVAFRFILKDIDVAPSIGSFKDAFSIMLKGGLHDREQELVDKYLSFKDLIGKDPQSTWDIALLLLDSCKFESADKVLNFGYDLHLKYRNVFNLEYYYLNKFQVKAHQGVELTEDEKQVLFDILKSNNIYARFGANILLKDYKIAESLFHSIAKEEDVTEILSWPIFKLLKPNIENPDFLLTLEKRKRAKE